MVRKTLLAALLASASAVGLRVSERQKKERLKLTFVGAANSSPRIVSSSSSSSRHPDESHHLVHGESLEHLVMDLSCRPVVRC